MAGRTSSLTLGLALLAAVVSAADIKLERKLDPHTLMHDGVAGLPKVGDDTLKAHSPEFLSWAEKYGKLRDYCKGAVLPCVESLRRVGLTSHVHIPCPFQPGLY